MVATARSRGMSAMLRGISLSIYTYGDPTVNGGAHWRAQTELDIYGSTRLGIWKRVVPVANLDSTVHNPFPNSGDSITFTRGNKLFELTNHLGNVLVTISDKRYGVTADDSTVIYYNPEVVSANDYYPFGMMQYARTYSEANVGNYRFGFNGQERSDEIKGPGNSYTAQFWEYDPRIGKRWNLDPKPNVWESPYLCFSDNPIYFSDIKGDSAIVPTSTTKTDDNYRPWMSMLTRELPPELLSLASKRFYVNLFKDQPLSEATGMDLNLDFYQLSITKLPGKFANGGELFEYIRVNFSEFINGSVSDFDPYDKGEKKVWESSNPNSSILRFSGKVDGLNLDDADVMTTHYTKSADYASWTFRPISNLNIINPIFGGDKGHPLAGNREFGIQKQGGAYLFYIQGIDRLWSAEDELTVGKVVKNYFFTLADQLWKQVMSNIANKINSMGGQATFDPQGVISKRIDYNISVRDSDKDKIQKSGN